MARWTATGLFEVLCRLSRMSEWGLAQKRIHFQLPTSFLRICLLNSGRCSFWAVCYDPPEEDDVFLEPCVVTDCLGTDPPPLVSASFGLCFMPSPPRRWIFRILQMLISKVWHGLRILMEFVGWVCSILSHYLRAALMEQWWALPKMLGFIILKSATETKWEAEYDIHAS